VSVIIKRKYTIYSSFKKNMKQINIHDKIFQLSIPSEKIIAAVDEMAVNMNKDLAGKNPLFICILNGSFIFAADLFRRIDLLTSEITFIRVGSYSGEKTTGSVRYLMGLNENIEGRTVVILEDIVDSGLTIKKIHEDLKKMNPGQILTATLLLKPDSLKERVHIDYIGMKIPNEFIVGYGLDYNGYGRNLNDICSIINE
jgi:hypoxanthine phosphoribosyltransferase